jgi:hypothetical protein
MGSHEKRGEGREWKRETSSEGGVEITCVVVLQIFEIGRSQFRI